MRGSRSSPRGRNGNRVTRNYMAVKSPDDVQANPGRSRRAGGQPGASYSPSFAALSPWLRHAAGFACGLFVFEAAGFACGKNTLTRTLSQLSSPISPGGTINLTESRWGRSQKKTQGTTEPRGPKGPRPTHVCLVRETRLLPPKAGRLASRSAKPTLDGSSLIRSIDKTRHGAS